MDEESKIREMKRFFSVESEMSDENPQESPQFTDNWYCSREFIFKIVQLLIGATCAGLYSEGVKIAWEMHNISSVCFPNVVFASYIIISSVIIISFMLGYKMPETLIRAFNSLATILYFIAASVTLHMWFLKSQQNFASYAPENFLLIQTILSYINSVVYGLDLFYSIRKAINFD